MYSSFTADGAVVATGQAILQAPGFIAFPFTIGMLRIGVVEDAGPARIEVKRQERDFDVGVMVGAGSGTACKKFSIALPRMAPLPAGIGAPDDLKPGFTYTFRLSWETQQLSDQDDIEKYPFRGDDKVSRAQVKLAYSIYRADAYQGEPDVVYEGPIRLDPPDPLVLARRLEELTQAVRDINGRVQTAELQLRQLVQNSQELRRVGEIFIERVADKLDAEVLETVAAAYQ